MNKTLLILGSDLGTYEIAKEAKKMGLYVIVSDLMDTSPTKDIADESWLISTTDIEELEKRSREAGVSGVICGANDLNATCTRELSRKLGLMYWCKDDYGWMISQNKAEFKKVCRTVGVPVATDFYIDDDLNDTDLRKICYPVVVKPTDSSGNRGMSYCSNEKELKEAVRHVREYSKNPAIVCERQLEGPEWVVNYILENGEARLLYFGRLFHQHGFAANNYSMIMTSNECLRQWNNEVNPKVKEYFKQANYDDGIAWFETIRDRDGKFYLIDPAYRLSSETLYSLFERVSGFNATKWYIERALGIDHDITSLPQDLNELYYSCAGAYHLFACRGGRISKITGLEEMSSMKNVVIDLPKRENSTVVNKVCMGVIKVYGETIDELIDTLKRVNSLFSVLNDGGDNMFIRFDEYEEMKSSFMAGISEFNL